MPIPVPIGEELPWYLKRFAEYAIVVVSCATAFVLACILITLTLLNVVALLYIAVLAGGILFALLNIPRMIYACQWHIYRSTIRFVDGDDHNLSLAGSSESGIYSFSRLRLRMTNGHLIDIEGISLEQLTNVTSIKYTYKSASPSRTKDIVLERVTDGD